MDDIGRSVRVLFVSRARLCHATDLSRGRIVAIGDNVLQASIPTAVLLEVLRVLKLLLVDPAKASLIGHDRLVDSRGLIIHENAASVVDVEVAGVVVVGAACDTARASVRPQECPACLAVVMSVVEHRARLRLVICHRHR